MHNIDRTQLEMTEEAELYGAEQPEVDEFGFEISPASQGESLSGELTEGPFSEAEVEELAAELLEVTDEAELEQFLGKLIRRAGKGIGRFVRSPIGRSLGGMLKGVAKKFLPVAGAALGNIVAPGVGGLVGGKLASMAGQAFGLELEGLSAEDQEFEVARRVVRLAGEAAKRAAAAPADASPLAVAQNALAGAARKYAPGLVARARRPQQRGVWERRSGVIVLHGV